jgi:uncharacterized protein YjiS (DUF1127 family)
MTLTATCTSAVSAAVSATISAFTAAARRPMAAIATWHQAQRDYHLLCRMEESALRDLGLTSSDLRDATTVGLFGDPTSIIASRAAERHQRRNR